MNTARIKTLSKTLATIVGVIIAIILLQLGIKRIVFLFVERTLFSDRVASSIAMIILCVVIVIVSSRLKVALTVFPQCFGAPYVIATAIAALLLVSTPLITGDFGIGAIVELLYGCVLTPIFEELIFRGYVWNKLKTVFSNEFTTYIVTTVLFALWHLGGVDSIALRVQTGLAQVMFWKVITGLCFGVVLGLVRIKTKNTYSTMLLHGVMNLFGR